MAIVHQIKTIPPQHTKTKRNQRQTMKSKSPFPSRPSVSQNRQLRLQHRNCTCNKRHCRIPRMLWRQKSLAWVHAFKLGLRFLLKATLEKTSAGVCRHPLVLCPEHTGWRLNFRKSSAFTLGKLNKENYLSTLHI